MICHNYAPDRAMDLHFFFFVVFFLVFKRSICTGGCEQDVRFLQVQLGSRFHIAE